MASKRTLAQIKEDAQIFCSCESLNCVQNKLHIPKKDIILLGMQPKYYHFEVRKASGGFRKIEAPNHQLKELQRKLNTYLQAVYYIHQSPASYGYIITPKGKKSKKNIVTNAQQHLGCHYLLHVDFQDFFHQITQKNIIDLLQSSLFHFNKKTAVQLAKVMTYKGRLPMGTPTSPVLSNLFTLQFDNQMQQWATQNGLVYTRFVDDLNFSSKTTEITQQHLTQINKICQQFSLQLNPKKTTFFNKKEVKSITHLVLNKTVDIAPVFYNELKKDLVRLHKIYEASLILNNLEQNQLLKKFKQEVQGQINFIGVVEGYHSSLFYKYKNKLKQALTVNDQIFANSWVHFSYI